MEWKPAYTFPEDFHTIALDVYQNDPLWIPEVKESLHQAFGTQNDYFNNNFAWINFEPGSSRLAGFFNPNLIIENKKAAFFGYWETIDNFHYNEKLFKDFESWARSKGAQMVYGPINFSTYGSYRIRLDHFENGCFIGEPYNPYYYVNILDKLGYKQVYKYFSWFTKFETMISGYKSRMTDPEIYFKSQGLEIQSLTPDYWKTNLEKMFTFIRDIFKKNFAYTEISYNKFKQSHGESYANQFCQKSSCILLNEEKEPVTFFIVFPDYSPLVRNGSKNRLQIKELQFNKHFKLLESPLVLGKTTGVNPKYRKSSLFNYISYYCTLKAQPYYSMQAMPTVREDNYSAKSVISLLQDKDHTVHSYGLFGKEL